MRFYPKKLRTVDDLELEKHRLLKERKQLDKEPFLPLEGLFSKKGEDGKGEDLIGSLLEFLPVSNPVVNQVIKMAFGWSSKKEDAPKVECKKEDTPKKPGKSMLQRAAIEFIGGYLKWKAIELSYKGIKYVIKKRREQG